jgi:hypothetical protein
LRPIVLAEPSTASGRSMAAVTLAKDLRGSAASPTLKESINTMRGVRVGASTNCRRLSPDELMSGRSVSCIARSSPPSRLTTPSVLITRSRNGSPVLGASRKLSINPRASRRVGFIATSTDPASSTGVKAEIPVST